MGVLFSRKAVKAVEDDEEFPEESFSVELINSTDAPLSRTKSLKKSSFVCDVHGNITMLKTTSTKSKIMDEESLSFNHDGSIDLISCSDADTCNSSELDVRPGSESSSESDYNSNHLRSSISSEPNQIVDSEGAELDLSEPYNLECASVVQAFARSFLSRSILVATGNQLLSKPLGFNSITVEGAPTDKVISEKPDDELSQLLLEPLKDEDKSSVIHHDQRSAVISHVEFDENEEEAVLEDLKRRRMVRRSHINERRRSVAFALPGDQHSDLLESGSVYSNAESRRGSLFSDADHELFPVHFHGGRRQSLVDKVFHFADNNVHPLKSVIVNDLDNLKETFEKTQNDHDVTEITHVNRGKRRFSIANPVAHTVNNLGIHIVDHDQQQPHQSDIHHHKPSSDFIHQNRPSLVELKLGQQRQSTIDLVNHLILHDSHMEDISDDESESD